MEHYLSKEVVLIIITHQEHETDSMHYSLTEIQRKYQSNTTIECKVSYLTVYFLYISIIVNTMG